MFKSLNVKSTSAIVAAAMVAGLVVFLTSGAQPANAAPQITGALHRPSVKGDRLPPRLWGAACSSRGWPHYEQNCQFDRRNSLDEAKTVRVIALR
jgi:hypothetical protein